MSAARVGGDFSLAALINLMADLSLKQIDPLLKAERSEARRKKQNETSKNTQKEMRNIRRTASAALPKNEMNSVGTFRGVDSRSFDH